jgi:carbamoylphosphate synthase small subunit
MRFLTTVLSVALATQGVASSSWFSKAGMSLDFSPSQSFGCNSIAACLLPLQLGNILTGACTAYNKWHETELERWLSDHNIPYPTPADRRDLEKLIQENWNDYVIAPYNKWDANQLGAYLQAKGIETKDQAQAQTSNLVSQVKGSWYETEDKTEQSWGSVKSWILDTWTESQLKAFCDKHNIPGTVD